MAGFLYIGIYGTVSPVNANSEPEMLLKQITGTRGGVPAATIFYAVKGEKIVFSAVAHKDSSYSSVNSAEDIVAEICRAERLSVMTATFWDLQTHLGYPAGDGSDAGYAAGQWGFDRLVIRWEQPKPEGETVVGWKPFRVTEWIPEDCPAEILRVFGGFVGSFVESGGPQFRRPGRRDAMFGTPVRPASF